MRKLKRYNFIVDLQIYPSQILFSFNESDEVVKENLLRLGIKEESIKTILDLPTSTQARCTMFENGQTVIRVKQHSDYNVMIGNISHEVFHAICFIFERIGIKFDNDTSDEAYAYAIGYVMTEMYRKLK